MRERPDATLEEIRGHLYQGIALDASEQVRPDVAQQCARWQAEQGEMESRGLGFLDEAGAKTNMTRLRARVKGGARAYDSVPAGRWSTTTMISSLRLDGQTSCMVLPGAMGRDAFSNMFVASWCQCCGLEM